MRGVFVDTVGLIALLDQDDQWHEAADVAWRAILNSKITTVTTTFVLAECGNAAARRPYRQHVDLLRSQFEQSQNLILPTDEEWQQSWRDYSQGKSGDASIVDHISFTAMRRVGITDAFSNDRHFKAAGFNTLF